MVATAGFSLDNNPRKKDTSLPVLFFEAFMRSNKIMTFAVTQWHLRHFSIKSRSLQLLSPIPTIPVWHGGKSGCSSPRLRLLRTPCPRRRTPTNSSPSTWHLRPSRWPRSSLRRMKQASRIRRALPRPQWGPSQDEGEPSERALSRSGLFCEVDKVGCCLSIK